MSDETTPEVNTPETPDTPEVQTPDTETAAIEAEPKPEQTVNVEDAGPARKKLTITIPQSRIAQKIEDSYGQLQTEASIPGFRVGRAPKRLIQKKFGSAVRDDVKSQIIGESYSQALEDHKLEVLGEPDVKDIDKIELPESGDLTFVVEIEVSPVVALPDFATLAVKKVKFDVADAQVDEEVEKLRDRFGHVHEITDGEVEEEDYVQGAVRVLAGEDAADDAEELASHPGAYMLVHGEKHDFKGHVVGIVVQDLGKRLMGKKVGDVERISMTGPTGHEDEKIRNQPITIVITLNSIQRLHKAEIQQIQEAMGVDSEDELKDRIRTSLEQRAEREQVADMHRQVSEQLAEKVELDLPEGLTSRQTQRILSRRKLELYYQGKTEDEVEQQVAEMRSGSEDEARRELKLFFILDHAAKTLEVEVDEEELNNRIVMRAVQEGRRPEKVRQDMQQKGELQHLYMQVREQKTLDAILAKAQVEEVAPPEVAEADAADAGEKKTKKSKKSSKKAADESAE